MQLYKFAGLTVSMSPRHSLTASRARAYLTNEIEADMTLVGDGDASEEYAQLAQSFYTQLLKFDGFLLHASVVESEGKAVAFSAPSGTGKSTHSSFWINNLAAEIINDDKPAVRLMNGVFYACGTPFSGKKPLSRNVCVPLRAIVFLTRAETTAVRQLSSDEALYRLLSQTLRPTTSEQYDVLLNLLDQIIKSVPVYEAAVPNDPRAATEVKKAIGF